MQRGGRILAAIFLAASLQSRASAASPPVEPAPQPAPIPAPAKASAPGPKRPERTLKFEDRPAIPWTELQFAADDVQRTARQFHELAESLVTKPEQAARYKDVTSSNMPTYLGVWTIPENVRRLSLSLHGQTIDGVDRFHYFVATSRAQAGAWAAEASIHVWPKTSQYPTSVSVFLTPIQQPHDTNARTPRSFCPTTRATGADLQDGSLKYRFRVELPHLEDPQRFARLMYGSPEEFLRLTNEDTESLRKLTREAKNIVTTVYDEKEVTARSPPRPMHVLAALQPELRARFEAAVDARLDEDLAVLKANYRDMHQAIQLALPRELYDSIEQPGK